MILEKVIIRNQKCRKYKFEKLKKLLETENIKVNGNIIATCKLECDLMEIRKQIKELLGCSYSQINCKYKMFYAN